jgi:Cu/Ag efflux protein CusF
MFRSTKFFGALVLALFSGLISFASAEETKGTIKSVDTGRNEVVLKGIVKDTVYELNKDSRVCLDGANAKLNELKDGDQATIIYEKRGEHMLASDVRALRNAQEATGTVRGIFADKHEITLKGAVKDTTYELNKDGTVWVNGKKSALTDVRQGDQVIITYQKKGDHLMATRVISTRK